MCIRDRYLICVDGYPLGFGKLVNQMLKKMCIRDRLVDFAEQIGADVVIRGLRAITDFEYELQMSQTNQRMKPDIETMFLTTSIEYSYLSSTTVREIAAFGGEDVYKRQPLKSLQF